MFRISRRGFVNAMAATAAGAAVGDAEASLVPAPKPDPPPPASDEGPVVPKVSIQLPMRDGVRLYTRVWLPEGATTPVPAILLRSPYGEHIISWPRMRFILQYREAGFAVVFQIIRGVGKSEGTFSFNGPLERPDGYDTVEWIAGQHWCDGAVGMDGASYLGMTQLAAACERPPHLKCIVPAVPSANFFREPPYIGGCFSRQHTLNWTHLISVASMSELPGSYSSPIAMLSQPVWLERMRSRPVVEAANEVLRGDKLAHYRDVLAHPTFDFWWRERTITAADYALVDIPTLVVGGNFDFGVGALTVWQGLEANAAASAERHLLIGPWDHGQCYGGGARHYGPYELPEESVINLQALRVAFFKHHLKGEGAVPDFGNRVKVFITGANIWRTFPTLPPAQIERRALFLRSDGRANGVHGDGRLAWEPAKRAEPMDHFSSDPTLPFMPAVSSADPTLLLDLRERERYTETLVYATDALQAPLTILGEPEAVLTVAADTPDCDLVVWLAEQRQDGRLVQLSFGALRLRYRKGFDREVLLTPGEAVEVRIRLPYIGHQIPAGDRLKLLISGGLFPVLDPNPNTGESIATAVAMRTAQQTLLHGDAHASRIELPVLP